MGVVDTFVPNQSLETCHLFCFLSQSIQNKTIDQPLYIEVSSDTQSFGNIEYYQRTIFFLSFISQDHCLLLFP